MLKQIVFAILSHIDILKITCIALGIGMWLIFDGLILSKNLRSINGASITIKEIVNGISKGGKDAYESIRKVIVFLVFVIAAITLLRDLKKALIIAIIVTFAYIISAPEEKIYGIKSPYVFAKEKILKAKRGALRNELTATTVQLKNLILSNGSKGLTTHYVLERLIPYTSLTKPYFVQLLSMNMKGEGKEAAKIFSDAFGFKLAEDFVYILLRLDELSSQEFLPQLDALLENFNEEKKTAQEKKRTATDTLIFALASAQVIAVIGNFIVLIFINTISQIGFW